jgi:exopolysaccharide biosynthesis polyprenyl glycosylphosphotransferase
VGFLSDEHALRHEVVAGVPVVGRISEAEKVIRDLGIGWVVVASRSREEPFPAEVLLAAKLRGCRVESGLGLYERLAGRIYLPDLRWSYLVFADGPASGPVAEALRRALDLAIAGVGLVLSAPLLALAAVAIRLDSPGPVFFRQDRVGRGDRLFRVLKLRSMCDGAEEATGAVFTCEQDERITRVGRILRRAHLDEVPQLWNVLLGDMGMVGPRPERPEFVQMLTDRFPLFRYRSAVRPGVTGWAQVGHGYTCELEAFETKLSMDLFYLKHRSLVLDLLVLWKTVKDVVLLRGM